MYTLARLLSLTLVFLFFLAGSGYSRIYSFTDDSGVVHFSNVPNDKRFKPLGQSNKPRTSQPTPDYYFDTHINDAARLYQIDPLLIKAVIKRESNFDRYARSRKGALGLMQLMPNTARDMNVTDSFDPRENIFGGTRYLNFLSKMFSGDIELMLASYNAGPGRVRTIRTIPDISETRIYVRSVLNYYKEYQMSL